MSFIIILGAIFLMFSYKAFGWLGRMIYLILAAIIMFGWSVYSGIIYIKYPEHFDIPLVGFLIYLAFLLFCSAMFVSFAKKEFKRRK